MFFEYTAFNDEREGIRFLIRNFNGLTELSKRKDGVKELVKTYNDFPIITQIQKQNSKEYNTPYKLPFIELLLSDEVFIQQLNNKELLELGKIVLKKYEEKIENATVYSLYNVKKTLLLGSTVLNKQVETISSQQRNTIQHFIENYPIADPNLITEISKIISKR